MNLIGNKKQQQKKKNYLKMYGEPMSERLFVTSISLFFFFLYFFLLFSPRWLDESVCVTLIWSIITMLISDLVWSNYTRRLVSNPVTYSKFLSWQRSGFTYMSEICWGYRLIQNAHTHKKKNKCTCAKLQLQQEVLLVICRSQTLTNSS